jgi:hypothetical protein
MTKRVERVIDFLIFYPAGFAGWGDIDFPSRTVVFKGYGPQADDFARAFTAGELRLKRLSIKGGKCWFIGA